MRVRQRHRHVQVGDPRLERGAEDRLVEARIAGVQHGVRAATRPISATRSSLVRGVDALGREAAGSPSPATTDVHALGRDVREHDLLERRAALRDRRERRSHAAGADDENLHRRAV